jgi:methionine-rich copper-binding protein CopC
MKLRRLASMVRNAIFASKPPAKAFIQAARVEELEPRRLLAATLTIAQENALPGTPQSVWFVPGAGDSTIQGYTTDISVDEGGTIYFKIDDTASAPYKIDIYRIGYYGGDGARLVTTIPSTSTLDVVQPAPIYDAATGDTDAGNWSITASWAVPSNATSGVYEARVSRTDTGGAFSMLFVVRDDASTSDILYHTSDATWEAYNEWGGNSLYLGTGPGGGVQPGRAYAVSYNRPVTDEGVVGGYGQTNYFWYAEYPLVRFMEENGYDVTYSTDLDLDRYGSLLLNHKIIITGGHDEYVSANMRANMQAAINAGVNMAYLTGNENYWKTEYDPSIDGSDTPDRTLTCYKDSIANALINPSGVWTGLWSDQRFAPASEDVMPGNELSGQEFTINRGPNDDGISITVPGTDALDRFWRNTAVAKLSPTGSISLGDAVLGYESDSDVDNGYRPAGEIDLSATYNVASEEIDEFNHEVFTASVTQDMSEYRAPSGALVFGAGTVQWSWGLDDNHDGTDAGGNIPPIDVNMQQATINLFADMGVQPTTLMSGMIAATESTDHTPPTSTLTVPAGNLVVEQGGYATVTGSSTDAGGGVVAGVEVSTDGGKTWNPVTSMSAAATTVTWSYTWSVGTTTTAAVEVRAADDSCNLETPKAAVNLTLSSSGQLYIFSPASVPQGINSGDANAVTVGVNFTTDVPGTILGIRFYKSSENTGTHVGSLWSSTGTLLATATFANETASGWQQVLFSTPVSVQPGITYTASYHTNVGDYSFDNGYFAQFPAQNGTIQAVADDSDDGGTANGVYSYGANSTFPTQTYESTNLWVDVVFAPSSTAVAPAVVAETPAAGSTNVPLNTSVSVTFNEQVNSNAISLVLTDETDSAVAATLTYNSTTKTATLTPVNPLAGSEQYMVTLNSVSDTSGDLLPAPVSWTFSTAAGISGQPLSIFSSTAVPGTANTDAPGAIEVGVNFESSVAGTINGIRFYKGSENTGTHIGNLWTSTGTLLATATFTNETASGWQQVNFATPVNIQANTIYVASYHTNVGFYSSDPEYFENTGVANGPLQALSDSAAVGNGVFIDSANSAFPDDSSDATNFWVDVVFTPGGALGVASVSPANGTAGVNPATTIVVTFNQALNAASVTSSTVQLLDSNNNPVAATLVYNAAADTVTITPKATLATATNYTVQILGGASGVTSSVGSLTLATTYNSTFTTVSNAVPAVTAVIPANNAANILITSPITVTFSEAMDASTISSSTIELVDPNDNLVSSTVTYNSSNNTATITPAAALSPGLTYSVQVLGSTNGVKSAVVDTPLAATYLSTFTTAASTSYSIFSSTTTPGTISVDDTTTLELGMKFESSVAGTITGVKFYKGPENTSTHTGSLWSSTGTLLATVTFTNETASGWQEMNFANPVQIQANTIYVVSYHTNSGFYSGDLNYFNTAVTSGPLTALANTTPGGNGVFAVSTSTTFPTSTYESANYYVDVVFTPALGPPVVTNVTPANGAIGVPTSGPFTVSFNEGLDSTTVTSSTVELLNSSNAVVPSTVTYNASTNSVTIAPTSALTAGANYTIQVLGGASGVKSSGNDVALAATFTSTFTTAATASSTITIFPDTAEPSVITVNDPNAVELGVAFESAVPGLVTGVRFYKGPQNTGTHIGNLWSVQDDGYTLLATATFTNETASGWQTVTFSSPVEIAANTTYIASYHTNVGFYSVNPGYFSVSGVTNGPLQALPTNELDDPGGNGLFAYGADQFPLHTDNANNYWVDVLFTPGTTAPPTVNSVTPATGATGITTSSTITVDFSEALNPASVTASTIELLSPSNTLVPATVTYNATTESAVLTPTSALAAGTTYTVQVVGGASGVESSNGNVPMTSTYTSTFTTTPAVSSSITVFSPSAIPGTVTTNDPSAIEVGMEFESSVVGSVTGVRFYKGPENTGTHVGNLWSSTGTLLATVTFTNETASGWQQANFSTPVQIQANTIYVISYHTNVGFYSENTSFFTSSVTSGPLTAPANGSGASNGVFLDSANSAFPTTSANGTNYWVDVVFTPSTTGPVVIGQTPASGATGIAPNAGVAVTFNESVTASSIVFALKDSNNNPVAATLSYNAATETATLTPTANLIAGATYTATLSNAIDAANNALAAPVTWSFTIAPAAGVTIFSSSSVPGTITVADTSAVELGLKFQANVPGLVTGVRFYKGPQNTGIHVGNLWSATGTLLASVIFNNETTSGWQQANFSSPVQIQANTTYVISYHTLVGLYSADNNYFATSGVTDGPLTALSNAVSGGNGVFTDGSNSSFPTTSFEATNYWVDVVFSPGATTVPSVIAQTPAPSATGVSASTTVTATFSEAVTSSSIVFSLVDSSNNTIATTLSYNTTTNVATWTPTSALKPNTTYTATITNATDGNGNTMAAPVTWTFTTAQIPTVTAETPIAGATGVSPATTVAATFSEAVTSSSIVFTLTNPSNTTIATTLSYNSTTNVATWTPTAALAPSTTYTATITNAVDGSGNSMTAPVTWTFTTAAAPTITAETPAASATGVATSTTVTATFSEAMTSSSIVFTLTNPSNTAIATTLSFNSTTNVATWTPTAALAASTTYTATISSATASNGATLAAPLVWTFTTAAATVPTVTAETPAANATGVSTATTVTATFSEAMTSSSIVFTLTNPSNTAIATTLSYNSTTNVATWTPTAALAASTTYTATISSATATNNATLAAPVTWTFTTAAATVPTVTAETPAASATGVSTATTITATFSEAMTSSSIVFTLTNSSNTTIATTLSYNSTTNVATWTPTAALAVGTVYTAKISSATATNGATLAAAVTWSFTTAAAVNSWTQTVASGFSSGTNSGTTVATGGVQLANEFTDTFAGTTLDSNWTTVTWSNNGGGPLADSVSNNTFTIKGGQALSTALPLAPVSVVGTFGAIANQIIGISTGSLLNSGNSGAIFDTFGTTTLEAIVAVNGTLTEASLGTTPTGSNTYEVNPTSTGVQFIVNGVVKTTIAKVLPTTSNYSVVLSALSGATASPSLTATSVTVGLPTTGTFTSSVFNSAKTATWGLASWTSTLPTGTSFTVMTRSGNTATPGTGWSAWQAVTNGGQIASPSAQYLQYEVVFATTNQLVTASLQSITFQWS